MFLGAHISLKDKKWNVGVEKCLGNRLMLAFCCHDLHDMNVLNGVFKEHWNGPNPSIIVSRFQVYYMPSFISSKDKCHARSAKLLKL